MAHGPTRFSSWGCCIYCGDRTSELTNEHIVPFAIGGHHVLLKASCLRCADITKKFEQDVMRKLWGEGRNAAGSPSRRKKQRAKSLRTGHPNLVKVPYEDLPPVFVFYMMETPGILRDYPPNVDTSPHWKVKVIGDGPRQQQFKAKYRTTPTHKFWHVPNSFGRLIAKIGYCQVLSQFGRDEFDPIVLPYILEGNRNISYLVGHSAHQFEEQEVGYILRTEIIIRPHGNYVAASVKLLANTDMATYWVVVGKLNSDAKPMDFLDRIEAESRVVS